MPKYHNESAMVDQASILVSDLWEQEVLPYARTLRYFGAFLCRITHHFPVIFHPLFEPGAYRG